MADILTIVRRGRETGPAAATPAAPLSIVRRGAQPSPPQLPPNTRPVARGVTAEGWTDPASVRVTPPTGVSGVSLGSDRASVRARAQEFEDAQERQFRDWYAERAARWNLDPDPDDPQHFYDYRAAFKAGAEPDARDGHWPSAFKKEGHPNLIVDGRDTRTGVPAAPRGDISLPPEPFFQAVDIDLTKRDLKPTPRLSLTGEPVTTEPKPQASALPPRAEPEQDPLDPFLGRSDRVKLRPLIENIETLDAPLIAESFVTDAVSKMKEWERSAEAEEMAGGGSPDPIKAAARGFVTGVVEGGRQMVRGFSTPKQLALATAGITQRMVLNRIAKLVGEIPQIQQALGEARQIRAVQATRSTAIGTGVAGEDVAGITADLQTELLDATKRLIALENLRATVAAGESLVGVTFTVEGAKRLLEAPTWGERAFAVAEMAGGAAMGLSGARGAAKPSAMTEAMLERARRASARPVGRGSTEPPPQAPPTEPGVPPPVLPPVVPPEPPPSLATARATLPADLRQPGEGVTPPPPSLVPLAPQLPPVDTPTDQAVRNGLARAEAAQERRVAPGVSPTGTEQRIAPRTDLDPVPSLALQIEGQSELRAVASLEEAARIVDDFRDRAETEIGPGFGSSTFPRMTVIDTATGKPVAHISYNGRVWDAADPNHELVERTDRRGYGKPATIDVSPKESPDGQTEAPEVEPAAPATSPDAGLRPSAGRALPPAQQEAPVEPKPFAQMTRAERAALILAEVEAENAARTRDESPGQGEELQGAPALRVEAPVAGAEVGDRGRARPSAPEGQEAPVTRRLLAVDTTTGIARDVADDQVKIGRKDILLEWQESGDHTRMRSGDQVTPDGLLRVKRGDFTLPEAAAPSKEPKAPSSGFDAGAFDAREKQIKDAIAASKQAGKMHLDQMPMGVEALRGRRFVTLRNGGEWVARTVDNRGVVYLVGADGEGQELASGAERAEFVLQPLRRADLALAIKANTEKQPSAKELAEAARQYGFPEDAPDVKAPTITHDAKRQSVSVKFAEAPDRQVLDRLKANGFRWNKGEKVWWRRTSKAAAEAEADARALLEAKADVKALKPDSEAKISAPAEPPAIVQRTGTPAVTAERVEQLIDILETYLADNVTDFPTVIKSFIVEFGEGARAYDRHVEVAWRHLTGQTVSVATALSEAQNRADGLTPEPGSTGQPDRVEGRGPPGAGDTGEPAPRVRTDRPGGLAGQQPDLAEGVSPEQPQQAPDRVAGAGDRPRRPRRGTPAQGVGSGPGPDLGTDAGSVVALPDVADSRGARERWFTIDTVDVLTDTGSWPRKLEDNVAALRLLKQLDREGRLASAAEQQILARYIGWGHTELASVVDLLGAERLTDPRKIQAREDLEALLSKDELAALGESSPNAHYSFAELPKALWTLVDRLGFKGGAVLEPAVGTGHFFGTMPGSIRQSKRTTLYAVDKEPIAAAITKHLYQGVHVQAAPLQEAVLPENYFDLIISNVPFGKIEIFDPAFVSADKTPLTRSVHNYFFGKALDLARPGGLVVFVTSRYTLDARTDAIRHYIDQRAKFVGAIRMPEQTFRATAGTDVVTDIIVLQKLDPGVTPRGKEKWLNSVKREDLGKRYDNNTGQETFVYTNEYFAAHPEMVLGKEARSGKMQRGARQVDETGQDTTYQYNVEGKASPEQIAMAVASFPEGIYKPSKAQKRKVAAPSLHDARQGAYVVEGNRLYVFDKGTLTPSPLKGVFLERALSFVPLRDAYQKVIDAMLANASDADLTAAQRVMRQHYDAFVKTHGDLSKPGNVRAITNDPNASRVLALEHIETVRRQGKQSLIRVTGLADIFTKRLMAPPVEPTSAGTASDALVYSLSWQGRVDLEYMAKLTGTPESALTDALAGEIYLDPAIKAWVPKDEYLSGDVVTKLTQAKAAAETDPRYARYVTDLTAVQPTPLTVDDFSLDPVNGRSAPFGATWIPVPFIERFLNANGGHVQVRLFNGPSKVEWYVDGTGAHEYLQSGYDYATWARDALNGKLPKLYSGDPQVFDEKKTEQYRQSLKQLKEQWESWWKADAEASEQIVAIYNAMFNREAERKFDGKNLITPNANPQIVLRPGQKDSIWRALQVGNTLFAQATGWGKTFQMIAVAGEWKRLGQAQKPMIVVPNHIVEQWRRDFLEFYPSARVLVPEKKDFETGQRKLLIARIANNDWDAIILPQSQFLRIGVKLATLRAFIKEQEDQLLAEGALQLSMTVDSFKAAVDGYAKGDKRAKWLISGRGTPRSVKDIARAILTLRSRLQKRIDQHGADPIEFEELGVDGLIVDEAHDFKNLFFSTSKNNIAGLKGSDADRAMDMFLKIRQINLASNYRNVIFGTATPVSNTMSEIYTMFRYLGQKTLNALGMAGFDAWANAYAEAVASMEKAAEGGYKERTRLQQWVNLRELAKLFRRFADVVTRDDVIRLELIKNLPAIRRSTVALKPHAEMKDFMDSIAARLLAIKSGNVQPTVDNYLKISGAASLAAVDLRLVRPTAAIDPNRRVAVAAKEIAARYKTSQATLGTQLVFLDVGVPEKHELRPLPLTALQADPVPVPEGAEDDADADDADELVDQEAEDEAELDKLRTLQAAPLNLYDELRLLLIEQGIKGDEVAFLHQAQNSTDQLRLYKAVQEGRIRVLITTRAKGGTGMNVQHKVVAVHQLDVPWRPDQVEQSEGRGWRQLNENKEVEIVRYVTENSYDEYKWMLLAKKQAFIAAFMKGDVSRMEDIDLAQLDYEVASALASGDPRSLELIQAERAVFGLRSRYENFARRQSQADRTVQRNREAIQHAEKELVTLRTILSEAKAWAKAKTVSILVKPGRWSHAVDQLEKPVTFDLTDTESRSAFRAALAPIMELDYLEDEPVATAGPFLIDRNTVKSDIVTRDQGGFEVSRREERHGVLTVKIPFTGWGQSFGTTPEWRTERPPDLVRSLDAYLNVDKIASLVQAREEWIVRDTNEIADLDKILAKTFDQSVELKAKEQKVYDLRVALGVEKAVSATTDDHALVDPHAPRRRGGGGGGTASVGPYVEIIPPGVSRGRKLPIQFPELVELAKILSRTPEVVKRFRKEGKRGEFRGEGTIRLHADLFKAGNEQQLAATLAHEIGHLIDWLPDYTLKRGNLLGRLYSLQSYLKWTFTTPDGKDIKNAAIKSELTAVSKFWRPYDPDTVSASFLAYRKSGKELYADAVSMLLNNPELLQSMAPLFSEQFFEGLDAKPDVKRAYFDLQEFLSGTPEELIAKRRTGVRTMYKAGDTAAIDAERLRQLEWAARRKYYWMRLRIDLVDKNTPVNDRVQALEARGIRLNPDADPRYFLEERNYLGGKLTGFLKRTIQPIYEHVTNGGIEWHTFGEALFYERIIAGDRSELANPRGFSPQVAAELYEDLIRHLDPEQRRELADGITQFRAAVQEVAERAYEAGLYTDAMYKDMQENPAYATYRVIEHIEQEVTAKVHRQVGTLKDIQNVADATVLKMLATLRAVEYQTVKVKTFDLLNEFYPDDIQQAREQFMGRGRRPMEPQDRKKWTLVIYYEHGHVRGKYVPQEIADSINNLSIGQNAAIVIAMRFVNGTIFRPLFTTFNPGFQTFNFGRDYLRFWKTIPGMTLAHAVRRYFEAVPIARARAFGKPETSTPAQRKAHEQLQQAEEAGIFSVTYNDLVSGRDVEDTQAEETFAKYGLSGEQARTPIGRWMEDHRLTKPVIAMLDFIKEVGDFVETLPKAAAILEFTGEGSISDLTPAQRSYIRRKVGSPDFLAGGTLKPFTNELFLFSNAITQAIRSDLEVAGLTHQAESQPHTAAGYWWKTVKLNLLSRLLLFGALAVGAGLGDDDEEVALEGIETTPHGKQPAWWKKVARSVQGMTEYDLTNYTNIPIWTDEQGNSVYLRVPQDDFGRLVGGLFWKFLQATRGDRDTLQAASQVFDYMAGQVPGLSPILTLVGHTWEMASGRNVYDAFRGRMLFTDDELKARGWQKTAKFLGYEFQQLGGAVVWKFYAGEPRPRELTKGQEILEWPVVSNIVGRWIRITNYGQVEKLRQAQGVVQQAEARERLAERAAVNDVIRSLRQLPPPLRTDAKVEELAGAVTDRFYGADPERNMRQETRDVLKKIRMGLRRGQGDALVDAVMGTTSNAQKATILDRAAQTMPERDFTAWLDAALEQQVITQDVLAQLEQRRTADVR